MKLNSAHPALRVDDFLSTLYADVLQILPNRSVVQICFDGVSSSSICRDKILRKETESLVQISKSSEGFVFHALLHPLET